MSGKKTHWKRGLIVMGVLLVIILFLDAYLQGVQVNVFLTPDKPSFLRNEMFFLNYTLQNTYETPISVIMVDFVYPHDVFLTEGRHCGLVNGALLPDEVFVDACRFKIRDVAPRGNFTIEIVFSAPNLKTIKKTQYVYVD